MDLIFAPANADVDSLLPSPSPPPATAAAEEKGGGGGAGVVNSAQQVICLLFLSFLTFYISTHIFTRTT